MQQAFKMIISISKINPLDHRKCWILPWLLLTITFMLACSHLPNFIGTVCIDAPEKRRRLGLISTFFSSAFLPKNNKTNRSKCLFLYFIVFFPLVLIFLFSLKNYIFKIWYELRVFSYPLPNKITYHSYWNLDCMFNWICNFFQFDIMIYPFISLKKSYLSGYHTTQLQ